METNIEIVDDNEIEKINGIDIMRNTAVNIYKNVSSEMTEVLSLKKLLRDSLINDIDKMTPAEKMKFHDKIANEFLSIADINAQLIAPKSGNGNSLLVSIQEKEEKKEDNIEEFTKGLTPEQQRTIDMITKTLQYAGVKSPEK